MAANRQDLNSTGELERARQDALRAAPRQLLRGSFVIVVATFVATFASASLLDSGAPLAQAALAAALMLALTTPLLLVIYRTATRRARAHVELAAAWQQRVEGEAARRDFETQLAEAFELSETEPEALKVIERSLTAVIPERPVELLLADSSHAHLHQLVVASHDGSAPNCPVASPNECPAARRSRVQSYPDSSAINACPKLEGRTEHGCSALCIPVSVMGRTVGVIHTIGERHQTLDDAAVTSLQVIANQAGTRLGMLRIIEESQLQASTDGLTGLLNRRALEHRFRALRAQPGKLAVAMGDLDHFKKLNDTYGHETGDRALRSFASTLRETLRTQDIVCRHGGEEFALILPGCTAQDASELLERVRVELRDAARRGGTPSYTARFGVVDADPAEDLEAVLRRADACLFEAKRAGRDRIVINGGAPDEPSAEGEPATRTEHHPAAPRTDNGDSRLPVTGDTVSSS